MIRKTFFLIISFMFAYASASAAEESLVLKAAEKELARAMTKLSEQPNPPYFLAYGITETEYYRVTASFGKIFSEKEDENRILDIDLRVGDYNFDNTHIIRGEAFSFSGGRVSTSLPVENNEEALRSAIWYATDKSYKAAIERYEKAQTNKAVKVEEEDKSDDLSHEKPVVALGNLDHLGINKDEWKARLRRLSAIFAENDWLYYGTVSLNVQMTRKYFVNSEGSKLQWSEPYVRVFISAKTKADDGMSLPLYRSYFAFSPEELPSEKTMESGLREIVANLKEMRKAPLMGTYSGPAILSGDAGGVFFHEIFGHRVEGHRLKDPKNAQTFKNSLNEEVLPDFLDVVCDPTKKEIDGKWLSGFYKYDDEGIPGQRVDIVKNGIFKNFLMSRCPIENFPHSNGHGRRQAGYKVASRQSNLMVLSHKTYSLADLKEKFREMLKKDGKEFGLYFKKVQGGFTFTGRSIPNSFNVNPILVYKVFADGRPDEMVRGVDLIGTPLTTFSNIVATGDDMEVFNGICGAESGGVPVSASCPHLLVSKIEVQKKMKSQAKPPILPAPAAAVNAD